MKMVLGRSLRRWSNQDMRLKVKHMMSPAWRPVWDRLVVEAEEFVVFAAPDHVDFVDEDSKYAAGQQQSSQDRTVEEEDFE